MICHTVPANLCKEHSLQSIEFRRHVFWEILQIGRLNDVKTLQSPELVSLCFTALSAQIGYIMP